MSLGMISSCGWRDGENQHLSRERKTGAVERRLRLVLRSILGSKGGISLRKRGPRVFGGEDFRVSWGLGRGKKTSIDGKGKIGGPIMSLRGKRKKKSFGERLGVSKKGSAKDEKRRNTRIGRERPW